MSPKTEYRSEQEMLDRLRRSKSQDSGNGPAWAFIQQVRNDAGFNATRTLDAMAMSLWPSRGLELHGFEVKSSRADFLTEMKKPEKAEAFTPYLDRFWLVLGDRKIANELEVPQAWGIMAAHGTGITTLRHAPLLHPDGAKPPDRGMLAAMLRQAGVAARTDAELEAARSDGYAAGARDARYTDRHQRDYELQSAQRELKRAQARVALITEAVGNEWEFESMIRNDPEGFKQALIALTKGERDAQHMVNRMKRLGRDARVLAEQTERILKEHEIEIKEEF